MNLAQMKHLFYKLPYTTFLFGGFVMKWGVVGGAPIVATIRIQKPSQKVWCLKAHLEIEVFWSSQTIKLVDFLQNVCEYFEIYRNKQTYKQANKHTSTQANQRVSNQRNTNPDICHLQCRLFLFGPMQWLPPLRGPQ
jgi:hypothetical protein